ncbi:endoplasmin homolog [Aristolochia californica]|uniref:endoplasmin homolog n=1 Tax=Aristolochia californica TaxID=171875 RepID=UPI0035DF3D46
MGVKGLPGAEQQHHCLKIGDDGSLFRDAKKQYPIEGIRAWVYEFRHVIFLGMPTFIEIILWGLLEFFFGGLCFAVDEHTHCAWVCCSIDTLRLFNFSIDETSVHVPYMSVLNRMLLPDKHVNFEKADFVEKMQTGGDLNLLGQFGVGSYLEYLVADYVEVLSKQNNDKQYVWESTADGAFAISEDTWNEPFGRGTAIRFHLRDEADEYLEDDKLKELVKRYSALINFPIYLGASQEVESEVPADGDESSEDEAAAYSSEEEEVKEEDGEKKPQTKKGKEKTSDWEVMNDVKAIRLRNPKEVTDEEYYKFYHSLAKDLGDEMTMAWSHFTAAGDVVFKVVLFVTSQASPDLYESYFNTNKANLKLYVRVFLSDEFDELLPKYLSFFKGLVDSDPLPLNVSREMLQQHSSLKTIRRQLIKKARDMIRRMADEDPNEFSTGDNIAALSDEVLLKRGSYTKFWKEFGQSIKLGIIEDATHRRMTPRQKDIFDITGTSMEQLEKSPFLERLTKLDYDVIFFTDPVDHYNLKYLLQ